jgi:hypothetical protein
MKNIKLLALAALFALALPGGGRASDHISGMYELASEADIGEIMDRIRKGVLKVLSISKYTQKMQDNRYGLGSYRGELDITSFVNNATEKTEYLVCDFGGYGIYTLDDPREDKICGFWMNGQCIEEIPESLVETRLERKYHLDAQ